MRVLVAVTLLFAVASANVIERAFKIPENSCGWNKYGGHSKSDGSRLAQPFVVGGTDADMNEFPYQVSLQKTSHTCGGSIINKRWILSAAHCFSSTDASVWRVHVGMHTLRTTDATEKTYKVKRVIKHEKYNSIKSNQNDIALMELATDLEFNDYVQPVCLATKELESLVGKTVEATGWGATKQGGSLANILQKVTVPVVTNADCAKAYPRETIYDSSICAGDMATGGIDTCQGDSGGPLAYHHPDGTYVQVGITSWGYGCAQKGQPGVYTRVSELYDWIQSYTKLDD